jgi:transposase InsO family protein
VLILAQNSRSLARGCPGCPGERIGARPVTSLIQSDGLPTTPSHQVLLPPVEPIQYTWIRLTEHLAVEGTQPSIGSGGDAYDDDLMETINRLYKAEGVRTAVFQHGPYKTLADVEYATAGWVDRYNQRRLYGSLARISPVEFETAHYEALTREPQPV